MLAHEEICATRNSNKSNKSNGQLAVEPFASTSEKEITSEKETTENTKELWMVEAIKEVAYYLRSHKFNEFDRRYHRKKADAPPNMFSSFPNPPLRTLHWEVHRNCISSFVDCIRYVQRKAGKAPLRRDDDTSVVAAEQKWTNGLKSDSVELNVTEEQCRSLYHIGQKTGKPFDGHLERFQWRTTASYYMCWYTMHREPALETIGERCDNYASCVDPTYGTSNSDFRAVGDDGEEKPFACARYSFCPDPCCPGKHYSSEEECWADTKNPCRESNGENEEVDARSRCEMRHERNLEFDGIVRNFWNVSCNCSSSTAYYRRITAPEADSFPNYGDYGQGYAPVVMPDEGAFVWDSRFGMCVDVDECSTGTDTCDQKTEACHNLPGGYACSCSFGHLPSSLYPPEMFPEKGKLDLECLRDKRLKAANDIVAAIRKIKADDVVITTISNGTKPFFEKILRTFGLISEPKKNGPPEEGTGGVKDTHSTHTTPFLYVILIAMPELLS